MKQIYQCIWDLAKPYYLKGRPMDVAHIEWMVEVALRIAQDEGLDESLLLPLVILHDVGYSKVKDVVEADYYQLDVRRFHMDEGAKIARQILKEVDYPEHKIDKVVYYISVHDNWAYGEVDLYMDDPVLGTFKDLDYIWLYTKEGCAGIQPVLKRNDQEMLEYLRNEVSPIGGKKPYSNQSTRKLRESLMQEREAAFAEKLQNKN